MELQDMRILKEQAQIDIAEIINHFQNDTGIKELRVNVVIENTSNDGRQHYGVKLTVEL
jgi:hypothetical protein